MRLAPCAHLGERVGGQPCGSSILRCNKFGDTTVRFGKCLDAARGCGGCADYTAFPDAPLRSAPAAAGGGFAVRHLLYHLYPSAASPAWRLGVDQLRSRWKLFTGRKVVAVSTGGGLESPAAVESHLPADCDVLHVPNSAKLREVATWAPLWSRVLAAAGDDDAVLYCHSKGATRPFDPGNSCHWWASLMYSLCLDHWPVVADLLARHPVCGPFKKVGRGFKHSRSAWHYSGAFFWARAGDVRRRPWQKVDPLWYGTEAWPGTAYTAQEAGELFMSGPVARLDVYDPAFWEAHVRPEYARWLARRAGVPA